MLVQRHDCRECLSAVGTADLLSAVGVHPLVSTEVRELGVGLAADSAAERLDAAVNVLVLFQAAGRREVLAALRTSKSTFRTPLHRGRGSKERPRAAVERDRAVGFFVWKETAVKVKRMTWRERLAVWRRAYQVDRRRSTTTSYLQPQTKNISNLCLVRGGRVVRCRTLCDREVVGSNPARGCCVPTPTQRAIPPGSVNE